MDLRKLEELWPYEKTLAWLRSDSEDDWDQSTQLPPASLPTHELLDRIRTVQKESLTRLTLSPEYVTDAYPENEAPEEQQARVIYLPRQPARVAQEFLFGVVRTVHISGIGSYSVEFVQAIRLPQDRALTITLQWLSDSAMERSDTPPLRDALYQIELEDFDILSAVMGPVLGAFIATAFIAARPTPIAFANIQRSVTALFEGQPVAITSQWIVELLVAGAALIEGFEQGRGLVK